MDKPTVHHHKQSQCVCHGNQHQVQTTRYNPSKNHIQKYCVNGKLLNEMRSFFSLIRSLCICLQNWYFRINKHDKGSQKISTRYFRKNIIFNRNITTFHVWPPLPMTSHVCNFVYIKPCTYSQEGVVLKKNSMQTTV